MVVEVSVDREPVCAQTLQVPGVAVGLGPPQHLHEGSIAPGPQQLGGLLLLLLYTPPGTSWRRRCGNNTHTHVAYTRDETWESLHGF